LHYLFSLFSLPPLLADLTPTHSLLTAFTRYTPEESDTYMFGGNSNWRGPIWFPVNYLIIESLQKYFKFYGDDFKVQV